MKRKTNEAFLRLVVAVWSVRLILCLVALYAWATGDYGLLVVCGGLAIAASLILPI